LANVADDLWLDLNGTLNLLIGRSLGPLAAEARVLRLYREKAGGSEFVSLLAAWKDANPTAKRVVFLEEFRKYVLGEPSELDVVTDPPAERT
jgi:hypothetical protein